MVGMFLAAATVARANGVLLVSGYNSDNVHRFNADTGAVIGTMGAGGNLNGAQAVTVGPDGRLYVCSEEADRVLRYDRTTFAYIDEFIVNIPATPGDETGGLDGPTGILFTPSGTLLVASFNTDSVKKYDGTTGVYLGDFVTAGSGGLDGPDWGITFGPDGNFYVPNYFGNQILRYNGMTGVFMGIFINTAAAPANLTHPRQILFRPGCGDALVNSEATNRILRYNATTGAFIGQFGGSVITPTGMAIGPDDNLYITNLNASAVVRWNGATGAGMGSLVPNTMNGGLLNPVALRFLPIPADANCDNGVGNGDLEAFIEQLLDPVGYMAVHPNCDPAACDLNSDGSVDGLDIPRFLDLIICG